eukprot:6785043-Pyramimonas_sp.AAC.1
MHPTPCSGLPGKTRKIQSGGSAPGWGTCLLFPVLLCSNDPIPSRGEKHGPSRLVEPPKSGDLRAAIKERGPDGSGFQTLGPSPG